MFLSQEARCCEGSFYLFIYLLWLIMVQDQCVVTGGKSKQPRCYETGFLKLKWWWLHWHLIPYMWQLVFGYISNQGWVIDSDHNCFFDGSCNALVLSAHNTEIINECVMTSCAVKVRNWWGGLHMFSEPYLQMFCLTPLWNSSLQSTMSHLYL